ncbi:MAG: putative selenate reductase subunit YgfK, partial [Spirochaetes bacterium]|nr:putative selenate reductase subunit YgfK [Candidatus Ornithospirochaeta stercoripullorum]
VRCIASARDAVDKAIDMVYEELAAEDEDEEECSCGHEHADDEECSCGHHHHDHDHDDEDEDGADEMPDEDLRIAEDRFFEDIAAKKSRLKPSVDTSDEFFARTEARRCMECSYLCLKCVDVCPNRANIGIDLRETGLFEDPFQVLHIDAYCNECGNCATFCPHSGRPYKDKFTLFSLREDFENSTNSGFLVENDEVSIRLDGKVYQGNIGKDGSLNADVSEEIKAIIEEVFLSYSYLLSPVEE